MKRIVVVLLLFMLLSHPGNAQVRLPAVIGSHMVLQQQSDITLWGWSNVNEKISIRASWDTATYTAVGQNTAKWSVQLKTPSAGGPYTITIQGSNTIVLDDVLIGEVWLCSGQSNMEFAAQNGIQQAIDEAPKATNSNIHLFIVPRATSEEPQDAGSGQWVVCNPADMKRFSAVGYFFGQKLQGELQVPVGLINCNWGGTPAEVWTPKDLVNGDPVLKVAAAKLPSASGWPIAPGLTYNAMIWPLTHYTIAGTIWYQGESNTLTWDSYQSLFTSMIGAWRKAWNKDFPFYFVQIAPYAGYGQNNIGALLRNAQTLSSSYPNTGMIVVSDLVSDTNNIHPQDKISVGHRLANLVLNRTYKRSEGLFPWQSPSYKSMVVVKNVVRLSFDHADGGLVLRDKPTEFMVAGEDKMFLPAEVKISGSTVAVWNKSIAHPVAVRFGFRNGAVVHVFNKEGLPLNLFRTDDWDVNTEAVKK